MTDEPDEREAEGAPEPASFSRRARRRVRSGPVAAAVTLVALGWAVLRAPAPTPPREDSGAAPALRHGAGRVGSALGLGGLAVVLLRAAEEASSRIEAACAPPALADGGEAGRMRGRFEQARRELAPWVNASIRVPGTTFADPSPLVRAWGPETFRRLAGAGEIAARLAETAWLGGCVEALGRHIERVEDAAVHARLLGWLRAAQGRPEAAARALRRSRSLADPGISEPPGSSRQSEATRRSENPPDSRGAVEDSPRLARLARAARERQAALRALRLAVRLFDRALSSVGWRAPRGAASGPPAAGALVTSLRSARWLARWRLAEFGAGPSREVLDRELREVMSARSPAASANPFGWLVESSVREALGLGFERDLALGRFERAFGWLSLRRELEGPAGEREFLAGCARFHRRAAEAARSRGELDVVELHLLKAAGARYLRAVLDESSWGLAVDDRLQAARCLLEAGSPEEVRRALKPLARLRPGAKVLLCRERAQVAESLVTMARALVDSGEIAAARRLLLDLLAHLDQAELDRSAAREGVRMTGPIRDEARLLLAWTSSPPARDELVALLLDLEAGSPRAHEAAYALAWSEEQTSADPESARERYRELLAGTRPEPGRGLIWHALAAWRLARIAEGRGEHREAARCYGIVARLDPRDVAASLPLDRARVVRDLIATGTYLEAEMRLRAGDLDAAASRYRRALVDHARSWLAPWACLRLGQILTALGQPEEAAISLEAGVDALARLEREVERPPEDVARSWREWGSRIRAELEHRDPSPAGFTTARWGEERG